MRVFQGPSGLFYIVDTNGGIINLSVSQDGNSGILSQAVLTLEDITNPYSLANGFKELGWVEL